MSKVSLKNGYLYWKEGAKHLRCPYSEKALSILQSRGYDTKPLLTLNGKLNKPLYHYQLTAVNQAQQHDWNLLIADAMGVGKAEKNGTKVLTPKGWVEIQNLKVGDKVYGSQGTPVTVMGVYPQGVRDCYKVTFNKEYSIICDKEHLWTAQTWGQRHSKVKNKVWQTLTTDELYKQGFLLHNANGYFSKWYLPVVKPIQFPEQKHIIPPRMLAILIAEGALKYGSKFTTMDKEIIDYTVNNLQEGYEVNVTKEKDTKAFNCCIRRCGNNSYGNIYREELRRLKLNVGSSLRFIPKEYIADSVENRLALLQGLIDTDGTVQVGTYEYNTTSKRLFKGVIFLAESLGCVVSTSARQPYYKDKQGHKIMGKTDYRIRIRPPKDMELVTLPKHVNKIKTTKGKYNASVKITNIEECGSHECTCIRVDAEDSLFVTEHCTLTHNTMSATACIVASRSKKTLIIVPANIKYQWERNLKKDIKKCPYIFVGESTTYELSDLVMADKAKIVILNYDIVSAWEEFLLAFDWDMLILDESQKIKKDSSNRTKTLKKLREKNKVKSCICLSGTPLTDRNADIFNSVWMVNPTLFPSRFAFDMRYCVNISTAYGEKSMSVNTLELNRKLLASGVMIRRTKKDVYKEIPKVTINIIPLSVSTSNLIQLEKDAKHNQQLFKSAYGRERATSAIRLQASLEHYLQEAVKLKLPLSIKWIEDFLENTEEKLLVGCVHREKCGNILYNYFEDCAVLVDGGITAKAKDKALLAFMTDPKKRLLIGNIQSISAGIDGLQNVCSHLALIELPWSPADVQQLFARLDRNGQTQPVTVHIQVVEGSLDAMLAKNLDKKSTILSEVLDGRTLKKEELLATMIEKV